MSIREDLTMRDEIDARLRAYADELLPLLHGSAFVPHGATSSEIFLDVDDTVTIRYEDYYRGESEWYSINIPISMWGVPPIQVLDYLLAKKQKEKRAKEEADRIDSERRALEAAAKERRLYEELKAKYENP